MSLISPVAWLVASIIAALIATVVALVRAGRSAATLSSPSSLERIPI
jgi:hypothetical protein